MPTPLPTATPIPPTPTPLPPTDLVCSAGCDFTTIQAALDDASTTDGAIIEVTDPVHTEAGIVVHKNVTIRGLGADHTIIQAHETPAEAPERVFLVEEGVTAVFERMTIRHGHPSIQEEGGGGIMNYGTLTLRQCVVSDNTANDGAGIYNNGTLTLLHSTVRDNLANAIAPVGFECGSGGGIKSASGTLTLLHSTVNGNEAEGKGGGVHVSCACTAVFTNSTISGNKAASSGGGIHVKGTLELVNCTISKNATSEKGGGVFIGIGGR
jgi:predicted outer membrane repeat protein